MGPGVADLQSDRGSAAPDSGPRRHGEKEVTAALVFLAAIGQATDENHPIGVHYHHAPLIWVLFFVGLALHTLLQIDTIARNTKQRRREVFYDSWIRIAYRYGFSVVAFGLLWLYPEVVVQIAGIAHIQIGSDEAAAFALPMNNLIALGCGLLFDSILGYIPILKSQLPPIEDPPPGGKKEN